MKQRIWELDAFRGICILGMVVVHFIYDLVDLYALVDWEYPTAFILIRDWGSVLFLLLSGICVTLGRSPVRRGLIVFACGMLCTLITVGMVYAGFAGRGMIIYFGILHCLGVCMLLWPLCRKLPVWGLTLLGAALVAVGYYLLANVMIAVPYGIPFGILYPGFASSDYFPLLPNFGFFLLGAVLGKTLYRNKKSLFPKVNPQNPAVRFFGFCGRQSLLIYLLHQPVLTGLFSIILLLRG